jgi:hypothetical protein
MFSRKIVQEALKKTLTVDNATGRIHDYTTNGQDSVISMLIHDIFGGEILKTHKRKDWHFYNRINGERIDFTGSETVESVEDKRFEDIPSTPVEASGYFDNTDYSTFFMKFVKAFEETVGLGQYRHGVSA